MGGGWCEGGNVGTSADSECFVGGDQVQVMCNQKREIVAGFTLETVNGERVNMVEGNIIEVFAGTKNEILLQTELKTLVGGLIEAHWGSKKEGTIGVAVEVDIGPKFHLGLAGQKLLITSSKLNALEEKLLAGQFHAKYAKATVQAGKLEERIGNMTARVDKLTTLATKMSSNAFDMANRVDNVDLACATFTWKAGGELSINAGKIDFSARGKLKIKGGSVKLEGGGATVEVGGQVLLNGTAFQST
jgi:hypothetical protein